MSRWIAVGLTTGIKTSAFPREADPEASLAPSAVQVNAQKLEPAAALAAAAVCPTGAIEASGNERQGSMSFDAGKCILCGRCMRTVRSAFSAVNDPRVAVRSRQHLKTEVIWKDGRVRMAEVVGPPQQPRPAPPASFRRSMHIRHVDAGSSNATESELQLLASPYYDLNRLGLFFTPTPRHADALLVTGVVTRQMEEALRRTYDAMAQPALVIAAGTCAISGGLFAPSLATVGPVDQVLPVDVYIPGSPPTPLALLHGLLLAAGKAEEYYRAGDDRHVA